MDFLKALGDATSTSHRQLKLKSKTKNESDYTESDLCTSEKFRQITNKKTFLSDV